jgi:hypothetical protein
MKVIMRRKRYMIPKVESVFVRISLVVVLSIKSQINKVEMKSEKKRKTMSRIPEICPIFAIIHFFIR